jgi:hypothetical protein
VTAPVPAALYRQLEHFYRRHWRFVDDGDVEACGRMFAEDAVLVRQAPPARMRERQAEPERAGRDRIVAGLRRVTGQRAAGEGTRRHWMGQLTAERAGEDVVRTRFATLVIDTPGGGRPGLRTSAVVEDVLVRAGEDWQIRRRRIRHDAMV